MNKKDIEKNRLDLSYKRNLQLLNTILIVGAGSFITYLAGLILNQDRMFQYTLILIIIGAITLIFYNNINENLKDISNKIKELNK